MRFVDGIVLKPDWGRVCRDEGTEMMVLVDRLIQVLGISIRCMPDEEVNWIRCFLKLGRMIDMVVWYVDSFIVHTGVVDESHLSIHLFLLMLGSLSRWEVKHDMRKQGNNLYDIVKSAWINLYHCRVNYMKKVREQRPSISSIRLEPSL